jgi:hypothetical protein
MVTGIRGSFGWVTHTEVVLAHGCAAVTCINPVTGETRTTELYSGEKVYYDPGSTVTGDPKLKEIDFIKEIITNDDFPAFVVEEMRKDESLQTPVIEDVPSVDVPKLLGDYDEIKAAEEEKISEKEEEIEKKLEEQTKFIENDPVDYLFDDERPEPNILQYNGNGADGGAVASQTSEGAALTVSANGFTRTEAYYLFSGWNTAADGSGTDYAPGDSITPSGTVTLYAQWEAHIDAYADLVTLLASNDSDIYVEADITYTGAAAAITVSGNKTLHMPAGVSVSTTDEITYTDGGSLTVTGGGSMTAANITISCTLIVEGGSIVNVNNDLVLEDADSRLIIRDGGSASVNGVLTLDDPDSAVTVESGGSLTAASMDNSGSVKILSGGEFELTGDSKNYGMIDNSGTAALSGTLINNGVLTNSGTMTVEGIDNGYQVINTGSFQCTRECWGESGGYDLYPDEGSVVEYAMNDGKVIASISGDTVTVTGTGPMSSEVLLPNLYGVTKAVVCEGVTSVNFSQFFDLTTVSFPSTLTALEGGAFFHCEALTQIELPDVITVIPDHAFASSGLTGIVLPGGVKRLELSAFQGCEDLTDISLPDGLEVIKSGAFQGCTSLAALTVPNTVTEIADGAFADCGALKSLRLPDGITKIDYGLFSGCFSLESVYIPAGVTEIGDASFYNCSALKEITLPTGLTTIGMSAFNGCTSLREIVIPESVTTIDEYVFYDCTSLETIRFGGTMETWSSRSAAAAVPSGVTVVCSDGTFVTE